RSALKLAGAPSTSPSLPATIPRSLTSGVPEYPAATTRDFMRSNENEIYCASYLHQTSSIEHRSVECVEFHAGLKYSLISKYNERFLPRTSMNATMSYHLLL